MGRLQDIMKRNTSDFVDIIERVSEPYADNLDWWVESPSSRNLITSSLYYNLCCIQFFKEIIELEDIGYVLVESLELKKMPRIDRDKRIYSILNEEMKHSIHSLQILIC